MIYLDCIGLFCVVKLLNVFDGWLVSLMPTFGAVLSTICLPLRAALFWTAWVHRLRAFKAQPCVFVTCVVWTACRGLQFTEMCRGRAGLD